MSWRVPVLDIFGGPGVPPSEDIDCCSRRKFSSARWRTSSARVALCLALAPAVAAAAAAHGMSERPRPLQMQARTRAARRV